METMNINFNIYADRRATGPRANLFIQFSWTENGKQFKRSISTKIRILREDYNWKKNTIDPVTAEGEDIRNKINAIRGFMLSMEESIPEWFINKTRLFVKSTPGVRKEKRYRLVELIDKHLELNSYSTNTKKAYSTLKVIINEYIEKASPNLSPDIMSLMDIDAQAEWFSWLVKFLISKGYRNQSTIQVFKTISAIKRSFSSSGIDVNPDTFVSNLRVVKPQRVHLTVEELRSALEIEGTTSLFDVFLLMCLTGMRTSEVRAMADVEDLSKGLTYVSQKTGTRVNVPLHPRAEEILTRGSSVLRSFDSEAMMREVRLTLTGYSIIKGTYLDSYFVGDKLVSNERLRAAGLTAHSGRHTFSHILTEAGVPIDDVSLLMGHSSGDTTRNFYRHQGVTEAVTKALSSLT